MFPHPHGISRSFLTPPRCPSSNLEGRECPVLVNLQLFFAHNAEDVCHVVEDNVRGNCFSYVVRVVLVCVKVARAARRKTHASFRVFFHASSCSCLLFGCTLGPLRAAQIIFSLFGEIFSSSPIFCLKFPLFHLPLLFVKQLGEHTSFKWDA